MTEDMRGLLAQRLAEEKMPPEIPISVAELHRRLLPYPVCRDRLGFASKAEYDLDFLRLLADRESLHVPEEALFEAARKEIDSPEPGLALLQRFAASEVRLRVPAPGPSGAGETVPAAGADAEAPLDARKEMETGPPIAALETGRSRGDYLPGLDDPLLVPQDEAADALGMAPPSVPGNRSTGGSRARNRGGKSCRSCSEPLPDRPGLRFCPGCGADQDRWPCPACGEEVERGWSYCALCGTMLPT